MCSFIIPVGSLTVLSHFEKVCTIFLSKYYNLLECSEWKKCTKMHKKRNTITCTVNFNISQCDTLESIHTFIPVHVLHILNFTFYNGKEKSICRQNNP